MSASASRRGVRAAVKDTIYGVHAVRVMLERHPARVRSVLGAELAQNDRVITAEDERDDARGEQRAKLLVDLLGRAQRVARGHAEVAAVDKRERPEHVDAQDGVVRAEHRRGRPDRLGSEARAAAEAGRGVERHSDHRRLDVARHEAIRHQLRIPIPAAASCLAHEQRVGHGLQRDQGLWQQDQHQAYTAAD